MKEPVLSIDDFKTPKIVEGSEAITTLLIRLILLEKGVIQSHPNMGIGLVSSWRYCSEEQLPDLQKEIYDQVSQYLPDLLVAEVFVYYNNKYLVIQIQLQDDTFVLTTDTFEYLKLIDII